MKRKRNGNMGSALTKETMLNYMPFYHSEIVRCKAGGEWAKNAVFHNITPEYLAHFAGWSINHKKLNKYKKLYASRDSIVEKHNSIGKKKGKKIAPVEQKTVPLKSNQKKVVSKNNKTVKIKLRPKEENRTPMKPRPTQELSQKRNLKKKEKTNANNLALQLNRCKLTENMLLQQNYNLFSKMRLNKPSRFKIK